jgi:hypothetical protein
MYVPTDILFMLLEIVGSCIDEWATIIRIEQATINGKGRYATDIRH